MAKVPESSSVAVVPVRPRPTGPSELELFQAGATRGGGAWKKLDQQKLVSEAKATKMEREAKKAHDEAIKLVEKHSEEAHTRLQSRLQKRKTMSGGAKRDTKQ